MLETGTGGPEIIRKIIARKEELLEIMRPSGYGKSTFLALIGTLEKATDEKKSFWTE